MKLNFCTLFNSDYLSRGMVLYQSLIEHSKDFHLYVFSFDDSTYAYLKANSFPHLTVISLQEFEDRKLLAIKDTRTASEYCWTCTPSTILYCFNNFALQNCIYVDADIKFYSDPEILVDEMNDKSVLITEHRYTPSYDQSHLSGKYCVQFIAFKNDSRSMIVLNWWRDACLKWCYARAEDGKFGDQKYLDDWTERFQGVHELKHLGGGIAPWNVQQYKFEKTNEKIKGIEISSGKSFEIIFFHFHGLKFYLNDIVSLTSSIYEINSRCKKIFYFPYIHLLNKTSEEIINNSNIKNVNGANENFPGSASNYIEMLKSYLVDIRSSVKNITGSQHRKRMLHHHYYSNNLFK